MDQKMVGSYHVRSTSMPSSSHPLVLRVEEQLCKLRSSWEASSSQSSSSSASSSSIQPTAEMLCGGLNGLKDLHDCAVDLLELPLTQQALAHHQHEKCADEALDGCLRMLDVCGNIGDAFTEIKERIQDLQSALRRRESGLGNKVGNYLSSRRKMKKEIEKCLRAAKRVEKQCALSGLFGEYNQHLVVIVHVLREARLITISILESVLYSFVSVSGPKNVSVGRSLVTKCTGSQRVACEREAKRMSEMEKVDSALFSFYRNKIRKDIDLVQVQSAQKKLEGLELSIQRVADGLDCMFRCLIKTRVSLLNIFNH